LRIILRQELCFFSSVLCLPSSVLCLPSSVLCLPSPILSLTFASTVFNLRQYCVYLRHYCFYLRNYCVCLRLSGKHERGQLKMNFQSKICVDYQIIDFLYRTLVSFTYRIIDLSIIEPAYLRK